MHMGFGFHAPELEVLILAKTGMATIPIAIKDFWLQGKTHHTTHRRLPHCWAHASGRWCRSDAHGGGAGASVPARGDGVLHLPGQAHGGVRAAATGGQRHGCALHRQHHTGKHTLQPKPTNALQCTGLGLMGGGVGVCNNVLQNQIVHSINEHLLDPAKVPITPCLVSFGLEPRWAGEEGRA